MAVLAAPAPAATTEQMSIASDGTLANDWSHHWLHSVSRTGRFVIFDSDATNLDENPFSSHHVFVHDRDSDRDSVFDEPGAVATTRASVATDGSYPEFGASYNQSSISPGGRFVAFVSDSGEYVSDDSGLALDVFVRDRNTDRDRRFDEPGAVKTVRVSLSTAGEEANDWSWFPVVSDGGRFVAYQSLASNLSEGDDNGSWDIYLRDRNSDGDRRLDEAGAVATRRLSLSTDGAQANNDSVFPTFSRSARFVAFSSYADNLVLGDENGAGDVFVRDRDTDRDGVFDEAGAVATVRVSLSSTDVEGDGESSYPMISANGRFVVFRSAAANLVEGDTNGLEDIFVRDRDADQDGIFDEAGAVATVRVNLSSEGAEADGAIYVATISGSGRFVAFDSFATNLVPGDTNGAADTFVRDRDSDGDGIFDEPGAVATVRTSVLSDGGELSAGGAVPALSANGLWTVFLSAASELHSNGSAIQDVFARGLAP